MSSSVKVRSVDNFEASLMPTGNPVPEEAKPERVRDARAEWLADVLFDLASDDPLRVEIGNLIFLRAEMNRKIDGLRESAREAARSKLLGDLEEKKSAARAQQSQIDELLSDARSIAAEIAMSEDRLSKSRLRVSDAIARRKNLSKFASAATVQKHDDAITAAEENIKPLMIRARELRDDHNRIALQELPAAQKRLREIADDVTRLEAALSGSVTDPTLGFVARVRI